MLSKKLDELAGTAHIEFPIYISQNNIHSIDNIPKI